MALLGERISAEQRRGWNSSTACTRRRRSRGGRGAGRALAERPDRLVRRHQAPAQPLAVHRRWTSSSAGGGHPAGDGGLGDFVEGVPRSSRSARPRFGAAERAGRVADRRRISSPPLCYGRSSLLPAAGPRGPGPRCRPSPVPGPTSGRPTERGVAQRRLHRPPLLDPDPGVVVFIGVEGALIYSLFKFRARKGAVAGPDPRQHAPGDRLDGRRGADPRGHRDRHVHQARRHPQRAATPTARACSGHGATAPAPRAAAARRQVAAHPGQRPAVRLALHVSGRRRRRLTTRLLLRDAVRAHRHDGDARDHRAGRRALVVDPRARRQVGRGPGPHELHVAQGPGRPSRAPTAGSAPSSAGATTPT